MTSNLNTLRARLASLVKDEAAYRRAQRPVPTELADAIEDLGVEIWRLEECEAEEVAVSSPARSDNDTHVTLARVEFARSPACPCTRCGVDLNAPAAPESDEIGWDDGSSEYFCLPCMDDLFEEVECDAVDAAA